jgi:hypothetical protein
MAGPVRNDLVAAVHLCSPAVSRNKIFDLIDCHAVREE